MALINYRKKLEERMEEHRFLKQERTRELKKVLENSRSIYGILEDSNYKNKEVFKRLDEIEDAISEVLWKYNS